MSPDIWARIATRWCDRSTRRAPLGRFQTGSCYGGRSRFRIAPHAEYRDGFAYQPTNPLQQYITLPPDLQPRYPRYFSFDARVSKDLNLGSKHAVRLALSGINLTNHSTYIQVHGNTDRKSTRLNSSHLGIS